MENAFAGVFEGMCGLRSGYAGGKDNLAAHVSNKLYSHYHAL